MLKQFFILVFRGRNWIFKCVSYVYGIDGSSGHLDKLIVYGCSLEALAPGGWKKHLPQGWFRAPTGPDPSLFLSWIQQFIDFVFCSELSKEKFSCQAQKFISFAWKTVRSTFARTSLSLGLVCELLEAALQVRTGCKLVFTLKTNVFVQFVATFYRCWSLNLFFSNFRVLSLRAKVESSLLYRAWVELLWVLGS